MSPSPLARCLAVLALSGALTACGTTRTVTASGTSASASPNAVNTLLEQGIKQAEANRVSDAVTTFEDVLAISPTNKYALYNLGLIAQERHDVSGAVARYDQALRADTTYTPAMYNKALILETSNPNESLALYRRIVELNPKASTAYLRMAIVYTRQNKATQAKQARARAIALDPSLAKYQLPRPCTTATC
jgi:tetratricopeptide (TPR) repeat protein